MDATLDVEVEMFSVCVNLLVHGNRPDVAEMIAFLAILPVGFPLVALLVSRRATRPDLTVSYWAMAFYLVPGIVALGFFPFYALFSILLFVLPPVLLWVSLRIAFNPSAPVRSVRHSLIMLAMILAVFFGACNSLLRGYDGSRDLPVTRMFS